MKITQEDFKNVYKLLEMYGLIDSFTNLSFDLDKFEFQMFTNIGKVRYNISNQTWICGNESANYLSELLKQKRKIQLK